MQETNIECNKEKPANSKIILILVILILGALENKIANNQIKKDLEYFTIYVNFRKILN